MHIQFLITLSEIMFLAVDLPGLGRTHHCSNHCGLVITLWVMLCRASIHVCVLLMYLVFQGSLNV